jgi:hypothetical protein
MSTKSEAKKAKQRFLDMALVDAWVTYKVAEVVGRHRGEAVESLDGYYDFMIRIERIINRKMGWDIDDPKASGLVDDYLKSMSSMEEPLTLEDVLAWVDGQVAHLRLNPSGR